VSLNRLLRDNQTLPNAAIINIICLGGRHCLNSGLGALYLYFKGSTPSTFPSDVFVRVTMERLPHRPPNLASEKAGMIDSALHVVLEQNLLQYILARNKEFHQINKKVLWCSWLSRSPHSI
jgi:hypothetical protein